MRISLGTSSSRSTTSRATGCSADADGDGICDDVDECIGTAEECDTCPEDLDGDGAVSINDLLALLSAFASFCPE